MKYFFALIFTLVLITVTFGQNKYYITADQLFDGFEMHPKWALVVENGKIAAVGPIKDITAPDSAIKIHYPNSTISPGFIEGHSHMFLYPYNITDWDTQVLKETDALRTIRATVHAKNTLLAGFTTARDLGTEGAGYADVSLKKAINDHIIIGPRLLVAGRAIVATGSYGPKGYDLDQQIMLGAEAADGNDLIRVVRDQIGKGADIIKVYADYRWGVNGEAKPTFTIDELKLINEVAQSSGRPMVCHASSQEAMRRAILAGVETIEHGDAIDSSLCELMKKYNVTLIPTLAAGDAIAQYRGWKKGSMPEPISIIQKKKSFATALALGVNIGMGGDVGVYAHGDNAREMELMVDYGMTPLQVLKAATSINAKAFHLDKQIGTLKPGMSADIIIMSGNPSTNINAIRKMLFVMKEGKTYMN
jgi:imidazolonepropionase-like amidohydrolase